MAEPRILIDCAYISQTTAMTGIPRVLFKYIEWGRRYGHRHGISVLPVYVTTAGVFDARFDMPGSAQQAAAADAPAMAADESAAGAPGGSVRQKLRSLVRRLLILLVGQLLPRSGYERLRQHYREWRYQRRIRRTSDAEVSIGPGDILFLPAYWHDVSPSAYRAVQKAGGKVVPLVHDMLPITMPENYNAGWRDMFRRNVFAMLTLCDHAFYITRATQKDVHDLLASEGVPPPPGSIRYHGFDFAAPDAASQPQPRADLAAAFAGARFSLLVVGSIEPKKNHLRLLRACDQLWATGLDFSLVIIGRPGWMSADITRLIGRHPRNGSQLFWFDDATDADLDLAFSQARLCVLPSLAEGFGLPLIEALARHVPVVASDIAPFREIAGEAVDYFQATSADDLAAVLRRIITNPEACADLARRAGDFSWMNWEAASHAAFDALLHCGGQPVPCRLTGS